MAVLPSVPGSECFKGYPGAVLYKAKGAVFVGPDLADDAQVRLKVTTYSTQSDLDEILHSLAMTRFEAVPMRFRSELSGEDAQVRYRVGSAVTTLFDPPPEGRGGRTDVVGPASENAAPPSRLPDVRDGGLFAAPDVEDAATRPNEAGVTKTELPRYSHSLR